LTSPIASRIISPLRFFGGHRQPRLGVAMRSNTVLLVSTVAAFGLYWAGALSLGEAPTGAASGQDVATWFAGQGEHVRVAVWLWTLSLPAFASFAALARHRLRAPHRDVFFVGVIAFIAVTAVSSWFWAGLTWHAERLEPATARTLLDVVSFWGPVLNGATITMLAPVVALSWGAQSQLPRWLGALGAIALAEQTVETVTIFGNSGFLEPGGAMNLQLGATLVSLGLLCLGLNLALRARGVQPSIDDAAQPQAAA
jgi:hypothetical protein